jgi:hypothetical protein
VYLNGDSTGVSLDQTFSDFSEGCSDRFFYFQSCASCRKELTHKAIRCPECENFVHRKCLEDHYFEEKCPICKDIDIGCQHGCCENCDGFFCSKCREEGYEDCCSRDSEQAAEEKTKKRKRIDSTSEKPAKKVRAPLPAETPFVELPNGIRVTVTKDLYECHYSGRYWIPKCSQKTPYFFVVQQRDVFESNSKTEMAVPLCFNCWETNCRKRHPSTIFKPTLYKYNYKRVQKEGKQYFNK